LKPSGGQHNPKTRQTKFVSLFRQFAIAPGDANLNSLMSQKIGVVGVGRMGANMARRLKECGFEISALCDLNAAAVQALAQELGATAVEDLRVVTKLSDVVITVVTDDKAMKKIFTGGLLSRAKGKLFINCATVTPEIHSWIEAKAEKIGAQTLEACMASSITQARQGSLYLMCGGKPEVFERAQPVLEKLGSSVRYIGPAGKAASSRRS
jgi:3-hydroxyisobutyrate dehydrogenase